MAGSGSKWLTGCGVGCLAVVLVAAGVGTALYLRVKSRMQVFEEARATSTRLERDFGKAEDFCPSPGAIARPRMEAFLEARRKAAAARASLEASFEAFDEDLKRVRKEGKAVAQVIRLVGQAFGLIPRLGEFQNSRNRALLDAGMGQGEYFYLYVLTYYSWLGKSPADGPPFRLRGREEVVAEDSGDRQDIRAERREVLTAEIRRRFIAMFHRQLDRTTAGQAEAAPDSWKRSVQAELAALEADPLRLPWQNALPKEIAGSLEPFRAELTTTYSPLVNPLELMFRMESGGSEEAVQTHPSPR